MKENDFRFGIARWNHVCGSLNLIKFLLEGSRAAGLFLVKLPPLINNPSSSLDGNT